mgnify:CR=1 FL=1
MALDSSVFVKAVVSVVEIFISHVFRCFSLYYNRTLELAGEEQVSVQLVFEILKYFHGFDSVDSAGLELASSQSS